MRTYKGGLWATSGQGECLAWFVAVFQPPRRWAPAGINTEWSQTTLASLTPVLLVISSALCTTTTAAGSPPTLDQQCCRCMRRP